MPASMRGRGGRRREGIPDVAAGPMIAGHYVTHADNALRAIDWTD
jgi:hypothetical protein